MVKLITIILEFISKILNLISHKFSSDVSLSISYLKPIKVIVKNFHDIEIEVYNYGPGLVKELKVYVVGLIKIAYGKVEEKEKKETLEYFIKNAVNLYGLVEMEGPREIKPDSSAKFFINDILKINLKEPIFFRWKTLLEKEKECAWKQIQKKSGTRRDEFVQLSEHEIKRFKKHQKKYQAVYNKSIDPETEEEYKTVY